MTSLTIKNVPEELVERLRKRAASERRSLNQQVLHLLEAELDEGRGRRRAAEAQVSAWEALGGRWESAETAEDEIAAIYSRRSRGRKVDL